MVEPTHTHNVYPGSDARSDAERRGGEASGGNGGWLLSPATTASSRAASNNTQSPRTIHFIPVEYSVEKSEAALRTQAMYRTVLSRAAPKKRRTTHDARVPHQGVGAVPPRASHTRTSPQKTKHSIPPFPQSVASGAIHPWPQPHPHGRPAEHGAGISPPRRSAEATTLGPAALGRSVPGNIHINARRPAYRCVVPSLPALLHISGRTKLADDASPT